MDKNYIFSTLLATISCTTVTIGSMTPTVGENISAWPELSVDIPIEQTSYVLPSQNSSYISSPFNREIDDFNILVSFAKKLLVNEVPIDEDIQHIIEEKFWDML